jgi:hypothetical protein
MSITSAGGQSDGLQIMVTSDGAEIALRSSEEVCSGELRAFDRNQNTISPQRYQNCRLLIEIKVHRAPRRVYQFIKFIPDFSPHELDDSPQLERPTS